MGTKYRCCCRRNRPEDADRVRERRKSPDLIDQRRSEDASGSVAKLEDGKVRLASEGVCWSSDLSDAKFTQSGPPKAHQAAAMLSDGHEISVLLSPEIACEKDASLPTSYRPAQKRRCLRQRREARRREGASGQRRGGPQASDRRHDARWVREGLRTHCPQGTEREVRAVAVGWQEGESRRPRKESLRGGTDEDDARCTSRCSVLRKRT